MRANVIQDLPFFDDAGDAERWLIDRGVPTSENCTVELFKDATSLRSRVRLIDEHDKAKWLDRVDGYRIAVVRIDQLLARIKRTACPS